MLQTLNLSSLTIGVALALSAFALVKLIVLPLVFLVKVKLRHGQRVAAHFFPLLGISSLIAKAKFQKLDSPLQIILEKVRANPNALAIVSGGFSRHEIYFIDPDLVKEVTVTQHENFKKFDQVIFCNYFLEKGLLLNNGEEWRKSRSTLAHGFNFGNLRDKCSVVQRIAQGVIAHHASASASNGATGAEAPHICQLVMRITGQVIFESFFGAQRVKADAESYSMELAEIVTLIGEMAFSEDNVAKLRLLGDNYWEKAWLLSKGQEAVKQRLFAFKDKMARLVDEVKSQRSVQGDNDSSLIDLLLQNGDMSKDELVHHFITLFFAGMDTTGFTTGICFYALTQNPKVLEKVERELSDLDLLSDDREITMEHLQKMVYIHAVIKEVLRLWNPVQFLIVREAIKTCKIGEFTVEAGTYVSCFTFLNAYNEKYFERAFEFDPDRWLDQKQMEKVPTFAYIPFSAGPRNCLGQHLAVLETKMIITLLLRKFKPVANPKSRLQFKQCLLHIPVNDQFVFLEPRK